MIFSSSASTVFLVGLTVKVAADYMSLLHLDHDRILSGTDIRLGGAAEVEATTAGDIDRTRYLASGDDLFGLELLLFSES
jgi:hypothetical protein